jgi:hypothetical protein
LRPILVLKRNAGGTGPGLRQKNLAGRMGWAWDVLEIRKRDKNSAEKDRCPSNPTHRA